MKISLIHGKYYNSWEALGLGYIGSYLKKHLPNLEIVFYQGSFDSEESIIEGSKDADFVAFSCTTPTFHFAERMSTQLKLLNPLLKTIVGGYHPSAIPKLSFASGNIDYVVVGEGEEATLNIITGKEKMGIVYGTPASLEDLPWPNRNLIMNERNIMVAYNDTGKRITSFQSHRGCPFMCKFCLDGYHKVLFPAETNIRFRQIHDLLNEMQSVTEDFNLDLLKFCDPTWNTNMEWVKEFSKKKIERKFDTPFYPNIHATLTSEDMFQVMADANCYQIAVGIESGSSKILKQIGKGTTKESIRRCIRDAKKANLLIRGYFIIGMPEENADDLKETEAFAEELDLDEYGFSILCPYPGTQMFDEKSYASIDWANADEYGNDFWKTNYLSNEELHEWQEKFTTKFSKKLTWHNTLKK